MFALHHAYVCEDLERFRSLLEHECEMARPSTSVGSKAGSRIDPNLVDHLGRTVLHLAATDGKVEYVEALLNQRSVDVTKPDRESGWTALHRALYAGHVIIARAILDHQTLRGVPLRSLLSYVDLESNTAFELYNSTVFGVNPPPYDFTQGSSDCFTFGSNANHTLGFSDADDRTFPERIVVKGISRANDSCAKFLAHRIRDIQMSKFHTLVITTDTSTNLYTCGFNTNGRLGISGGTQFTLQPITQMSHVVAVAAAQDHSLAITITGDLFSWGSQSSGQLGYDLDPGAKFSSVPRRVTKLAKEFVIGVCASATHSVCFTKTSLFTWGLNNGQLGYELTTADGKVVRSPKKVTVLSAPVKQATATRYATICLLESHDVLILTNYGYFKLALQLDRFASQYQVFRPIQSYAPTKITKVSSSASGGTIAVMTSMGDVFSFILDESTASIKPSLLAKHVRPGRVWSLRKKHNAIKDCSVGQEESIIMCTESGSVFIGKKRMGKQRTEPSKADYKFSRVAGITRVVQVRGSEQGAFGLLRDDVPLPSIPVDCASLAEDLLRILPYGESVLDDDDASAANADVRSEEDSDSGIEIPNHAAKVSALLRRSDFSKSWTFEDGDSHDMLFLVNGSRFPAHRVLCCARSTKLKAVIMDGLPVRGLKLSSDDSRPIVIIEDNSIGLVSFVVVLHWMYTDAIVAPWIGDTRPRRESTMALDGVRKLAALLETRALSEALSINFVTSPRPTLSDDLTSLRYGRKFTSLADLRLMLADGEILTYSVVLSARSEFFQAMVSGGWLGKRQADSLASIIEVDLKHLTTSVMNLVLDHILLDRDLVLFDETEVSDLDAYLEIVLQVLAAATELILPRLKQACQAILSRFVHRKNISVVFHEADLYSAEHLKEACLDYCTKNLQYLLENNFLSDLSDSLMQDLQCYIHEKQVERLPISKSGKLMSQLLERHPSLVENSKNIKLAYEKALSRMIEDPSNHTILQSGQKTEIVHPPPPPTPTTRDDDSHLMFRMDEHERSGIPTISPPHTALPQKHRVASTTANFQMDTAVDTSNAIAPVPQEIVQHGSATQETPPRAPHRGWIPASPASITDLRSVLQHESSHTFRHGSNHTPNAKPRTSQKSRRKQACEIINVVPEFIGTSPSQGSIPWATSVSPSTIPFKSILEETRSVAVPRASSAHQLNHTVSSSRSPSTISAKAPRGLSSGGYTTGTVISPSAARNDNYKMSPTPSPSNSVPAQSALSLAEIIAAEEHTKAKIIEYNAKRSMKEIQEQEAFEQWFQQESIRVQIEEKASLELAARLSKSSISQKSKKTTQKKTNSKNAKVDKTKARASETDTGKLKPSAVEFRPR